MNNFTRLIFLVTFAWVTLILLSYVIFIVVVPFPALSNTFFDRFMVGVLKVLLSAILFILWLLSLLLLRNYIANKSIFK